METPVSKQVAGGTLIDCLAGCVVHFTTAPSPCKNSRLPACTPVGMGLYTVPMLSFALNY